jgi:hypothetical protein
VTHGRPLQMRLLAGRHGTTSGGSGLSFPTMKGAKNTNQQANYNHSTPDLAIFIPRIRPLRHISSHTGKKSAPQTFSRGALGAYLLGDTVYRVVLTPRVIELECHSVVRDGPGSPDKTSRLRLRKIGTSARPLNRASILLPPRPSFHGKGRWQQTSPDHSATRCSRGEVWSERNKKNAQRASLGLFLTFQTAIPD